MMKWLRDMRMWEYRKLISNRTQRKINIAIKKKEKEKEKE